jgi:LPS sulfotransferase NodH
LRRRNIVDQALSKLIANKTQHWHRRTGERDPSYRVEIGQAELAAELDVRELWTSQELDITHPEIRTHLSNSRYARFVDAET